MISYEEAKNIHNPLRREYEKQGHDIIQEALKKYYPKRNFVIDISTDDWDRTDLKINGKKIEYKCRWWKTQEEVDKYKQRGFVLSTNKLPCNDVFFYYIQYTKELYMISKQTIEKYINEGVITTTTLFTDYFQFSKEYGKRYVENYVIPLHCFEKCFQL